MADFKQRWLRLLEQDKFQNGSFPLSPRRGEQGSKIVVGVFSTLERHEIRQVLRDTWMQHPDVCTFANISQECTVRVAFVVGRTPRHPPGVKFVIDPRFHSRAHWSQPSGDKVTTHSSGLQVIKDEPDVVLLDVNEGMDWGKTFTWFEQATKHLEWADFIMKADDDVFLHVTNIIEGLPDGSKCPQSYLGKAWTCKTQDVCPKVECGPPVGHNFTMYMGGSDPAPSLKTHCWSYMQGGFYGLSRPLAARIARRGGYWDNHKEGFEDLVTGRAVNEYARRTGECVHIWDNRDVFKERMYFHLRGGSERPGNVSRAWDAYYGEDSLRGH